MSVRFSHLRSSLREGASLLDSFIYRGRRVTVSESFQVSIDGEVIGSYADLDEARSQAEMRVSSNEIVEERDFMSDDRLASIIASTHDVKITDTMLESYRNQLASGEFSIDPVITAVRRRMPSSFADKTEYELEDGSVMAVSEETQSMLASLLEDKYSIVKYMRVSKENFMHVVRKLGE